MKSRVVICCDAGAGAVRNRGGGTLVDRRDNGRNGGRGQPAAGFFSSACRQLGGGACFFGAAVLFEATGESTTPNGDFGDELSTREGGGAARLGASLRRTTCRKADGADFVRFIVSCKWFWKRCQGEFVFDFEDCVIDGEPGKVVGKV